jgi:hypothetical protein
MAARNPSRTTKPANRQNGGVSSPKTRKAMLRARLSSGWLFESRR